MTSASLSQRVFRAKCPQQSNFPTATERRPQRTTHRTFRYILRRTRTHHWNGVPERLQFHLGTRKVPCSSLNMPVWGMLIRLAEWWKGTLRLELSSCRGTGGHPGKQLSMVVAWYILFRVSWESTLSQWIRCLAERSCPFM